MSEDFMIFAVLMTGGLLISIQIARLFQASMRHRTIREAISRDNPAVPQLLAGIEEPARPAGANDDRTAYVLIALGIALFGFGMIQGDQDDIRNMSGVALFPLLVGVALLLRWYLARRGGPTG